VSLQRLADKPQAHYFSSQFGALGIPADCDPNGAHDMPERLMLKQHLL
jgi:hypothetical protein